MATLHGSSPSGNCSGSGHSCQYTNWGMWMLKTRCHTQIRCGNFKGVVLLILLMDDKVGDDAVHKELGDKMERAATTASSLEVEQDSDAQTRFETTSKQFNDPPLSKVNTCGSGEDSMQLMELMTNCIKLSALLGDMSHYKEIYVNPSHTKKFCANMKRAGKDFSGRITPLFDTMMVQAFEEVEHEESVPTPSNDPLPSSKDSMQLNDLMVLCTKLQKQVLDLEKAKSDQAIEIASLKKRIDKL
ncbi:hypothetical protein Tco_0117501 [Tanacetum coccineum]